MGIEDIKTYIDWERAVAEYPEFLANPAQMVTSSRDLRNLIHPGRCVREARTLDDRTAQVALGFFYVGMLSFLNNLGSELIDAQSTKLAIKYSPQLKRLIAARQEIDPLLEDSAKAAESAQEILQSPVETLALIEVIKPLLHDLKNPEN